jgi:hypothetical protein
MTASQKGLSSLKLASYLASQESRLKMSQDSSVSIVTGLKLDGQCLTLGRGKSVSLLHSIQTSSGGHSASQPMATGGSFPEVKQPGFEGDHSTPSSAKVKNGGAIPPLPHKSSWHSVLIKYAHGQLYLYHIPRWNNVTIS